MPPFGKDNTLSTRQERFEQNLIISDMVVYLNQPRIIEEEPEEEPEFSMLDKAFDVSGIRWRWRRMTEMRYIESMKCKEIAKEFSISQQRVSQIVRTTVERLKSYFKII